ncbi:GntR family transcriptional regulator [Lapidilactobacillus dextrinicus]|nr:GntR family transcriptional regulator [Lapidilactobacillus dextrinicus]
MPKYMIIANQLRQQILAGDFAPDGQLPQESRLTTAYNVSRITIRKALDILVTENLIYRVQGAGTYVKYSNDKGQLIDQNQAELFNFDELEATVINFSVVNPPDRVVRTLEINKFDLVYVVERVLTKLKEPVIYQKLFFPIKFIQGMRMDALNGSITDFMQNELDVSITSTIRHFLLGHLNEQSAEYLHINPHDPLLLIEEKMYLKNGVIGVFDQNWINTEKYNYGVRILLG